MTYYSTGGYTETKYAKVSKNKPRETSTVLFQALAHGPKHKKVLNSLMAEVNGNPRSRGYCDSTIAWHTTNGRLLRTKIGKYSVFSLTTKGRKYAKERGIDI